MININIEQLLNISISMAAEKNGDVLLEKILTDAMSITNCDGGTLYILNNDKLEFKVMITRSLGIKQGGANEKIDLPPVWLERSNVCAYSVLENKLINIADVYKSDLFDFCGPIKYDSIIGYRTTSMMVVPMENNKGEIIGVMQLINAKDENNNIIPFEEEGEIILLALASQAAVCLTNMNYLVEIKELIESMVKTMSTAVHLRTPYNVTHTSNMVKYAEKFIDWLNNKELDWSFTDEKKRMFIMSIWLHDIGKLITPLAVMNKSSRLAHKHERIMARLDIISLLTELKAVRENKNCENELREIEEAREFITEINRASYFGSSHIERITEIANKTYINRDGKAENWLTSDEVKDLSIISGTLTSEERAIMQEHVSMTGEILSEMKFKGAYALIPHWAVTHHEFLNGTGYPNKLTADSLDKEARLLTILDIFDGLAAKDRPYKTGMPIDRVFNTLEAMAEEGKLDKEILALYKESEVWN